AGSAPTLDESQAGSPVLVGGGPLGAAGGSPLGGPGGPTVPPNEDLIVEIQLAPGATALRSALVGNTTAFLGSAPGTSAPAEVGLAAVLRRYGLIEAWPTHNDAQVQQDEQRMSALRHAAAIGAASPEHVAARERLPSKASFVRLKFPAGTTLSEVRTALKRL